MESSAFFIAGKHIAGKHIAEKQVRPYLFSKADTYEMR
jgi:hypothetical protein